MPSGTNNVTIAPSRLAADFTGLGIRVTAVETPGYAGAIFSLRTAAPAPRPALAASFG